MRFVLIPSFLALMAAVAVPGSAAAAPDEMVVGDIPKTVTLADALRIFHKRGYDLLLADASVLTAEGDLALGGAIPNPSINAIYGRVIDKAYDTSSCGSCSANSYTVGVSDNGAIFDSLSNKRGLRLAVARKALAVARLQRKDAERTLDLQVKQAWYAVAAADAALRFAKEVQASAGRTLQFNEARFPGKIDEGALARIQTAKLETDRQVATAASALELTKVGLAFLLGVRDSVPAFDVPMDALAFAVPPKLSSASPAGLKKIAFERRPDWLAASTSIERAEESLGLANRMRFPDVQLFASYNQIGTGQSAVQPPTLSFGVTITLPSFYRYEGEIKKAKADIEASSVQKKKLEAQINAEVFAAFETWTTQRQLVESTKADLLPRATKARDITEAQFNEGKALLTDYLDAQRTFIGANVEYLQDLANYWVAVSQLEQAVGMELRA